MNQAPTPAPPASPARARADKRLSDWRHCLKMAGVSRNPEVWERRADEHEDKLMVIAERADDALFNWITEQLLERYERFNEE